jgi:protein O-mannosyl-transferase
MGFGMLQRIYRLAISVALITFIVYLPTLRNGFVNWDDDIYVVDNPHIRSFDVSFVRWAFLDFHASNWHPLTWISHALDRLVWGFNPLGHHLSSIFIHAINSLLVVILISKLLEAANECTSDSSLKHFLAGRTILITAGVTGLLFGIHPLHVESVAWISERKDLLCGLFYLLSVIMYLKHAQTVNPDLDLRTVSSGIFTRYYLTSLGLFSLALLSKPMAVTLPIILLLIDWYPMTRLQNLRDLFWASLEKLPFLALSVASAIITIFAQKAGESIVSISSVPLTTRLLVASHALASYLWKTIVPLNLLPFYPHPINVSLYSAPYLATVCFSIVVTATCLILLNKKRFWTAMWGCFVVTLLPVLGILQVGGQSIADRYMYLPGIVPFLLIGLAFAKGFQQTGSDSVRGSWVIQLAFRIVAVMIMVLLVYLTIMQIGIWKSSIDLWNTVIRKEPNTIPLAYYNRGQAFMGMGEFEKAIEDYSSAIIINPIYVEAVYNRGIAFEKTGQIELAIKDFERTISLRPSSFQASNNLGVAYGKLANFEQAISQFNRSLDINSSDPGTYFNRGYTYAIIGKYDKALEDFNTAIGLNRQFAPAYMQRGNVLLKLGRKEMAISDFAKACEMGIQEACMIPQ